MLTEGEIFQIIIEHYHSGQPGEFFKGTPKQFKAAAAAIAKRLSEGVVWRGHGTLKLHQPTHHGITTFWTTLHSELEGESMTLADELVGDKDGQLVEVTVKVKGAADEKV